MEIRDLVSRDDHGFNVEPKDRGPCQKRAIVRVAHDHAPMGREDEAVEILVIERVVRSYAARDVGRIVVAYEMARIVELELLLRAMHPDPGRKTHLKHPPGLAMLFVWRDLLAAHVVSGEQERHSHVVV